MMKMFHSFTMTKIILTGDIFDDAIGAKEGDADEARRAVPRAPLSLGGWFLH
jgi:hypothetical protein